MHQGRGHGVCAQGQTSYTNRGHIPHHIPEDLSYQKGALWFQGGLFTIEIIRAGLAGGEEKWGIR